MGRKISRKAEAEEAGLYGAGTPARERKRRNPPRYFGLEQPIDLRCLCCVADRPHNHWLALVENVVFRVAFGGFILLEFMVFVLLVWGISHLLPEDNEFITGALILSVVISPFAIGSASYLVFQRLTRTQYVLAESERWLKERQQTDSRQLQRRRAIKRWALWIPAVTVVLVCACFDDAWALASHLLHPGRGRLIGYEVSIPLRWTIQYSDLGAVGNDAHAIVVASRFKGLWRAGSGRFLRRHPPFSVSTMNFRSSPGGDPLATTPASTIISERARPFGKDTIVCREEVRPRWMETGRYIECSTPTGDFSGRFSGNDEDAAEFYRVIESVKRR